MKDPKEVFAERIKKILVREHITQIAFADSLGIKRQTAGRYVSGQTLPDTDILLKISEKYHVSMDYLLIEDYRLFPDYVDDSGVPLIEDLYRYVTRPSATEFFALDDNGSPIVYEERIAGYCRAAEPLCRQLALDEIGKDLDILRQRYFEMLAEEIGKES